MVETRDSSKKSEEGTAGEEINKDKSTKHVTLVDVLFSKTSFAMQIVLQLSVLCANLVNVMQS